MITIILAIITIIITIIIFILILVLNFNSIMLGFGVIEIVFVLNLLNLYFNNLKELPLRHIFFFFQYKFHFF
jgi:hypothetical protein